jgi:hypothetical protein
MANRPVEMAETGRLYDLRLNVRRRRIPGRCSPGDADRDEDRHDDSRNKTLSDSRDH